MIQTFFIVGTCFCAAKVQMIYVLLPRLKNKKQEIWTIQTHERAIVFTNKTNGDVDCNASVPT